MHEPDDEKGLENTPCYVRAVFETVTLTSMEKNGHFFLTLVVKNARPLFKNIR